MNLKVIAVLPMVLFAGCGPAEVQRPAVPVKAAPAASVPAPKASLADPTTPDAPFRVEAPGPDGSLEVVFPDIQEHKLRNGLRVLLVERHQLPIVAVRIALRKGAGDDGHASPLTLAILAEMLELGTKRFDAKAISDGYEAIGAEHGTWMSWDSGGASTKVLTSEIDRALEIMSQTVLEPNFPEDELAKLKQRRIGRLALDEKNPRWMADNAKDVAIFGRGTPYGRTFYGRKSDIEKVSRVELLRAHERLFARDNAAIVVAGDVTAETLLPKLEARFARWKTHAAAGVPSRTRTESKARLVLVDKPGAPQSQVYVAELGPKFATPDRITLSVTNAILGGMFSSRINLNLREKHAYTYGASTAFWLPHAEGLFYGGGAILTPKTAPAVAEILSEVSTIASKPVSLEELANAKEYLRQGMLGRFETVRDVAASLAELVTYDLPLNEFESRRKRIDAVTVDDVSRVARAYLHPDRLKVIVVGDLAKIRPELEGLKLGDVEVRDAYGDLVK